GTLDVAGNLQIRGALTNGSSGKISVGIGGTSQSQFSQIDVSGTATLDGTLAISRAADFTPDPGSQFRIITQSSRSGDFATVTGAAIGTDRFFKPHPESTAY